jgi:hypothetical protein
VLLKLNGTHQPLAYADDVNLPFSPKPSVFPSVVKRSNNENIQDYNFACL